VRRHCAFLLARHRSEGVTLNPMQQIYGCFKNALIAMIPRIGYDNSRGYQE
jgi:hypothetical protein